MSFWVRIKKKINQALEKMAKDNEQAFGKGKLDCCQLNKNAEAGIIENTKKSLS